MELCQAEYDCLEPKPLLASHQGTASRLLDGLMAYRTELGETGMQLELLLRKHGVVASTDVPGSLRRH